MTMPDSVLKHDGRRVAFDALRLGASVSLAAEAAQQIEDNARLGRQMALAVGVAAMEQGKIVVATADLRSLVVDILRDAGQRSVADAYQNHARAAALMLWRVRVCAPETQANVTHAPPWDRRRLLESLREAGIAADDAGAAARDVERRIVALKMERVSPALIHALALLALPENAPGVRIFAARRVAFNASTNLPNFDRLMAVARPLPRAGAALEEFWLQCVHSPAVVEAVRARLLAPDPYPYSDSTSDDAFQSPLDPLKDLSPATLSNAQALSIRVDNAARISALATALGQFAELPAADNPLGRERSNLELLLHFKKPTEKYFDTITINAGGLVAREAIRDVKRVAVRLGELASTAALAHREREDYFNRSPVRGRLLPISIAGVWNAASLLQGDAFDASRPGLSNFAIVEQLSDALRQAVQLLRTESGMNLILTAETPDLAAQKLWREDRAFFARDGLSLDERAGYFERQGITLSPSQAGSNGRLESAKNLSAIFDEPPAVWIEIALAGNKENQWLDLFTEFAKCRVGKVQMSFNGGARALQNCLQTLRAFNDGFPLLDGLEPAAPPQD